MVPILQFGQRITLLVRLIVLPISIGILSGCSYLGIGDESGGGSAPASENGLYQRDSQRQGAALGTSADIRSLVRLEALGAEHEEELQAIDDALIAINQRLDEQTEMADSAVGDVRQEQQTLHARLDRLRGSLTSINEAISNLSGRMRDLELTAVGAASEASAVRSLINQIEESKLAAEGNVLVDTEKQAYALHLASYRSMRSAQDGWLTLREEHPSVLRSLSARLHKLDLQEVGGVYYRLVAGPFDDVLPARRACEALREAKSFCQVAVFKGDTLGDG